MRRALLTLTAVAVAGCGAAASSRPAREAAPARAAAPKATPGYPSSIAVLGHSGATGEDSDPAQPHVEIRTNSWATGTNPRVDSVYTRILAKNPAIRGHNFNLAHGGATVDDLLGQAQQAVALRPDLVLVQIMDNDIVCPASSRDYATFRAKLIRALRVLESGLPRSRFFLVSQWGSPTTYWKALRPAQRAQLGGTGPCAFLDPQGKLVPRELRRLERIIHSYEAQLKAGCERVRRCRYDGGAFGRQIDRRRFISEDLNHFSVAGHAKAAAVAWAALRHAGLIP
jgi:hypothetical protein